MGCHIPCLCSRHFCPGIFSSKVCKKQREPGRKRQLNHQNLLPAHHHSHQFGLGGDGGLFHLAYLAFYRHGDLWHHPDLDRPVGYSTHTFGCFGCSGGGALALGAERAVPGCATNGAFPYSNMDVCYPPIVYPINTIPEG